MTKQLSSKNRIKDESNDKKYFILVPQIVMALCRNPYDYTLWSVIKMIAGEYGECTLSTEDLAKLAMMSVGKASDSRTYLLAVNLLEGKCYRDPGYPQPVWHLTVPDVWPENINWRQVYDSLKDRVELKQKLRALFEEADIHRRFNLDAFMQINSLHNVNLESLHNMKPSQYEEGVPQNEGMPSHCEEGVPQNEGKKNQVKPERKTKRRTRSGAGAPKPETRKTTPAQEMFGALAEVCKYDLAIITEKERGQLNQAEKKMRQNGYSPTDLKVFSAWWYEHDWRGQKGQPPTLSDMRETWGRFRDFQKNGPANGGNHGQTRRSNIKGLRELGSDNPIKPIFDPESGEDYYIDARTGHRTHPNGCPCFECHPERRSEPQP